MPNEHSYEALLAFLGEIQQRASHDKHGKLVSITMPVLHIDPLAVMDSIYEPTERHFYLEHPAKDCARAGAESVVLLEASGSERFTLIRNFAREITEHSYSRIVFGQNTPSAIDLTKIDCSPQFFVSLGFDSVAEAGAPFPAATVFVPRWQVTRENDFCLATANLLVDGESSLVSIAERIWRAHLKFSRFNYREYVPPPPPEIEPMPNGELRLYYRNAVSTAVRHIRDKRYQKIVLARYEDYRSHTPWRPLEALDRLRNRFPNCHLYSVANGKGQSFIGASPELLLTVSSGVLETEAIAGSAPRGKTLAEDAQFAGSLLTSEKDLHEHRLVVQSILRRLQAAGVQASAPTKPQLLKLSNVQHLRTPISANLSGGKHLLDIAAELHPTPALGGTPREAALKDLRELEGFPRGLYGGLVGWFKASGEGQLIVAIRSALIDGENARLYAGAGIVEASDPAREELETDIKLAALRDALVNPAISQR